MCIACVVPQIINSRVTSFKLCFEFIFMCGTFLFQYANLTNAIGPYSYTREDNSMPSPVLCLYQYKEGSIFGFNESFVFNSEIEKREFSLNILHGTSMELPMIF
jgi:hypothetical protein